jgi:TolA-binding protein
VLEAGGQTQFRLTANDAVAASAQQPDSSARAPHPPTRSRTSTAQWLARARSELAAREVESARATLTQALAQAKSRSERAEALTLQAEYELVAGSGASASIAAEARYLRVAEDFSPLRAAQTALFAAARLAAERGDRGRASELFCKYLASYPHGSFAKEARERLLHLTR